jgi:hypothetical protein
MSIPKAIDQIVEAFIPEMERISRMDEGEEQKERHYKAWLRATLQKFADDVREIEASQRGRAFSRPPCSLIPHCRASVEARAYEGKAAGHTSDEYRVQAEKASKAWLRIRAAQSRKLIWTSAKKSSSNRKLRDREVSDRSRRGRTQSWPLLSGAASFQPSTMV